MLLCYWENKVTFRYKHIVHQLFIFSIWKVIWKRQREKVLTSFLYLSFPGKVSASFWIVQSTLLAVFSEGQLKELRATEVTVLLEDVDKVQVLTLPRRRPLSYRNQSIDLQSKSRTGFYITASILKGLSLTQSELRNTVDEVDWETIDETKSSFQQGLNSNFDCLPLLNLDAKLSIFGSFKQIFFEADLVWLGLLFFLFWIVGNNGAKWFEWNFANLTKVPNGSLQQNNILKHFWLILLVLGVMWQLNKYLWLKSPTSG